MTENHISARRVNKDLPVPYYYQIVQILRESIGDIKDMENKEEILLPSEAELCETFSVNRGTIRHALDLLEREGLIYREKGRGTFIRRRRVELDLTYLCSTTEDLKNRGWEPSSELLSITQVTPRLHIQHSLHLNEGEKVWEIYKLRFANGEPISLQRSIIPVAVAPNIIKSDLSGPLWNIWTNDYHIQPKEGEQTIRTRRATGEEAELLQIEEGAPIFEITRVTYDTNNRPFEYLISLWRGDRYDFYVHLTAR
jgi:GntR family transcriptional regulator